MNKKQEPSNNSLKTALAQLIVISSSSKTIEVTILLVLIQFETHQNNLLFLTLEIAGRGNEAWGGEGRGWCLYR